jgi:DNA-3-methyladenine glycosylase
VRPDQRELLPRSFFDRPATEVAPDLLGCIFWSDSADGRVAVRLVEVEAYMGGIDPASHSFRGETKRNAVMFGPPGHAYVYFTYGMHFCVNFVCSPPGEPTAVLVRAGEVIEGAELAAGRRLSNSRPRDLARGPARLCQALSIDRGQDGIDVCVPGSALGIGPRVTSVDPADISHGPRIGITQAQDRPWRFWLAGDTHVSSYREGKPRRARGKPLASADGRDGTMQR